MSRPTAHAVDLEQLDATVAELTRCQEAYDQALHDVVDRVARLHLSWVGAAADAHGQAQRRWETGFATMRDGLEAMRAAGGTAHDNYRSAVAANLSMWEAL